MHYVYKNNSKLVRWFLWEEQRWAHGWPPRDVAPLWIVRGPSLKSRLWREWVPFRRRFILTLRMARVGLKEQTFLVVLKKKVGQVVKMRGFLLVFDRSSSCRKCRVSRGPRRLGACFVYFPLDLLSSVFISSARRAPRSGLSSCLAILKYYQSNQIHWIPLVFPWRYRPLQSRGYAVPSRSIDIGAVDSQVSLSCLARLDFSCPVTRDCRKTTMRRRDGWSACWHWYNIQFRCGKRQDTISDKRGIHNTRLTRNNRCG